MDKIFNKPFAVNGARVAIPENGTENERVSFDKGFTQPYEVEAPSVDNPAGQGFNILRPEMNEALYQLSLACNVLAENIDKWTPLTTENLNDIKQAGRYYQRLNINATSERNYPVNIAGYLIVFNNSINAWGVTQFYKVYNSDRVYIRCTISATEWSAWDSFVLTSEYNEKIAQLQNSINTKEDKKKITLQLMPNQNWNNVKTQGLYYMNANGTNKPTSTDAFFGIGLNYSDDGSFYQEAHDFRTGRIYSRHWDASSWSAWDRTAMISEVYTKTQSDSIFLTIANANSTYRKIADSYTKSEVNTKTFDNSTLTNFSAKIGTTYTNTLQRTANFYFNGRVEGGTTGECKIQIDGTTIFNYAWDGGDFTRPLKLSFLVKPGGKFLISGSNFTFTLIRQA